MAVKAEVEGRKSITGKDLSAQWTLNETSWKWVFKKAQHMIIPKYRTFSFFFWQGSGRRLLYIHFQIMSKKNRICPFATDRLGPFSPLPHAPCQELNGFWLCHHRSRWTLVSFFDIERKKEKDIIKDRHDLAMNVEFETDKKEWWRGDGLRHHEERTW